MPTLDDLLRERPGFDLPELADAANELLPRLLPDDPVDARVKPEVNPRLVRHYVSEGLLDPALKDGRRALYTVDHLLQLLALRRLLADGVASTYVGEALRSKGRDELRAIAEGFADLGESPVGGGDTEREDPRARARAALAAIRQRSSGTTPTPAPSAPSPGHGITSGQHFLVPRAEAPPDPDQDAFAGPVEGWERVPLLDGVELHVRDDVRLPRSDAARQRLLDHVVREIVRYAQRRDR